MEYKSFNISKKPHFITKVKKYHIYYGNGNSKTSGYFDKLKSVKLFIDWIVLSKYNLEPTPVTDKIHWAYLDSLK